MKDFTIEDIAREVKAEMGLEMNRKTLAALYRNHMKFIFKIMGSKKNRISMRECDVHTIYKDPNLKELCGKVADLDETREFKFEKGFNIRGPRTKDPSRKQKRWAKRVGGRKDLMPELNA